MLLWKNNQWQGGGMQPHANQSYCYDPEVDCFSLLMNNVSYIWTDSSYI